MEQTALENFYQKYGKETVDKAIEYLTYKNPSTLPKHEEPNKPTIYIFRHGESQDNKDFLFSGWRDADVTTKGMQQALTIAPLIENKKIDMLISSTQLRAYKTMLIATTLNIKARSLKIETDTRIKERSYGILQGKSKLEQHLQDPELTEKIRRDYYYKVQDGESLEDVVHRVKLFCDEIIPLAKEHKLNIAISCHGNSIRGFRKYFEPNLTNEEVSKIETPLGQDYAAYSL